MSGFNKVIDEVDERMGFFIFFYRVRIRFNEDNDERFVVINILLIYRSFGGSF